MRQRLFLLALAALVPLVALSVGLTIYSLRQQQAALRTEAAHRVADMLDSVERELLGEVRTLAGLAASPYLDGPDPDLSAFHAHLTRLRDDLRHWDNIILADLERRQILNARAQLGSALPPLVDEGTYRRVVETRLPVIGNVSGPGPLAGDRVPRVSIRVPVLRDGTVRYVLTAVISPDRLAEISGRDVDPQWRAFLLDGSGRIAASRRTEIIGERPVDQALAVRAASREGVYEGVTLDGLPSVTAFRTSDRIGWSAHVAIPRHLYNAPLTRSLWYLGASILAALAATLLLVEFLRREAAVRERRVAELQAANRLANEKSALLEATLENMDQGLIMVDGHGILQVCNRRAVEMLDLPPEYRHCKPSFSDFLAHQVAIGEFAGLSEERVPWLKLKGNLLSAPPIYERMRPNGTALEVRTVHLPDGTAVRTFTDITARRQAEAERARTEERYRLLAENATDMIIRTGLDGVRRYVSPACRDILGSEPEEFVGARLIDIVHPDDRDVVASSLEALVSGRVDQETSAYRVPHKAGHWVWLEGRRRLVRDQDGKPLEVVSIVRDISERVRLEDELRAALEANRAILDHSQDVICTVDESGVFTQVSPQALRSWGYLPQELIGRPYMELVHPDDRKKTIDVARKVMSGTPTSGFENRYVRRDGVAVPILWSAVWSDEHRTMYCVARDLSERLQLEEQLRQAQKMEAVGQLTGGIAHDFNNLLTVILGNAEVLTDDPSDPALTYALARQILETAERGADLNQKLLAFGRRQTLKPERTKVGKVIENMVPLLYRTIGEHIELKTELTETSGLAIVDRSLLESAVLNLAVNARDAMPQGGSLTIAVGERTAYPGEGSLPIGQPVVFVRVSDTGTGMPPDVMAQVFEPFFTTKEVGKGSGLGLSMVFGFAQQSAGHVGIESKVGAGTAVTIVLPAVTGEVDQAPQQPSLDPVPTATKASILVVEDEPQVLQFVSTQLVSLGYEVAAVSTGQDAVELLERGRDFDVLFTDVVLPKGMSGVELVKRVRAITPGIKVLLTSGYPEDVFEQHGGRDEATPLLHKPYRRKDLAEALRTILGA